MTNRIGTTKKKTQLDVIKDFMSSLDKTELKGIEAVDEAVKFASSGQFENYSKLTETFVADRKKAKNADTFLKDYCGIDLGNKDTGAITGLDAGGTETKTAESIVPEVGEVDKTFTNNFFEVNGVTFELVTFDGDGTKNYNTHVSDLNFDELNEKEKFIWQSLHTWWAKNSIELISKSYGSNFGFGSDSSATTKTIHVGFFNAKNIPNYAKKWLAWTTPWSVNGKAVDLDLKISMKFYDKIKIDNPNGKADSRSYYLDRTLAHEFTHAVMNANISYFSELPQLIKEGVAELTSGTDDGRKDDIKKLAKNVSLLEKSLKVSTEYTEISEINSPDYVAGYMLLRYFTKQVSKKSGMQEG